MIFLDTSDVPTNDDYNNSPANKEIECEPEKKNNATDDKDPDKTYDAESFEGDGLPDIESKYDNIPFQNDILCDDDAVTVTMSGSEEEEDLVRDETPFYPNQEEDPEIQAAMFQEMFN